MAKTPSKEKSAEISFEKAVARLDEVVEEMQSPELPLKQLIERYEEGMKLLGVCGEKLAVAEQKIELLTRQKSGTFTHSTGGIQHPPEGDALSDEETSEEARLF